MNSREERDREIKRQLEEVDGKRQFWLPYRYDVEIQRAIERSDI